MEITNAIYIKLGEGGCWEKNCIETGKIRIGWKQIDIDLIKKAKWEQIKKIHEDKYPTKSTVFYNNLYSIIGADDKTVFITFFSGKMYWCVPKEGSIKEDSTSKYLETKVKWSYKSINGKRLFTIDHISGRLSKYRGYLGTSCIIRNKLNELNYLTQIINNKETSEYKNLFEAKENLKSCLIPAIMNLIPKDFEILVDLIFRYFGWKRTSVLGETMKFFDIILEEPFEKALHGVQIKSKSKYNEYKKYKDDFLENYQNEFSSFFFVVHTPDKKLEAYNEEEPNIKKLTINEISEYAIEAGLIDWVMEKAR